MFRLKQLPAVAPHAPETGLIALSLNANPLSVGISYVPQTARREIEKEGQGERKREGNRVSEWLIRNEVSE